MGSVTNPAGMMQPSSLWGVFNNLDFMIQQAISRIQTCTIVKVVNFSDGMVDVQNLVNQITGQKIAIPHTTMYRLPFVRLQAGSSAVIMDPQPGDIGLALFASRDITNVKSTKAQANPNTFRTYDYADGIYVGGILNATPSQYIQFTDSGVTIVSPTAITLQAPSIVLNGALQQTGGSSTMSQSLAVADDVTASGISLKTHTHTGGTISGDTGEPIP